MQDGGNIMVGSPARGSLELTFRSVSPVDAGNYSCRSRNPVGTDESYASLTVNCKLLVVFLPRNSHVTLPILVLQ